ncbi:MAG: hypothetical protein LBU09_03930 [Endomicrobium sp.]|nr:hypothetical protein [Endomicrobium sp.]
MNNNKSSQILAFIYFAVYENGKTEGIYKLIFKSGQPKIRLSALIIPQP